VDPELVDDICALVFAVAAQGGTLEDALRELIPVASFDHEEDLEIGHRRCVERAADDATWSRAAALLHLALTTGVFRPVPPPQARPRDGERDASDPT